MKELVRLLLPLKRAVIKYNLINFTILGFFLGILSDIAIITASKFMLIHNLLIIAVSIPVIFCAVAMVTALLVRPKTKKLCAVADSLGLSERCITAYELLENCKNDEIHLLEITDTLDKLKQKDFEKEFKPKIWLRLLKISPFCMLFLLLIAFFPSPMQDKLDEQAKVYEKAIEEYEKIEKDADEIITDKKTQKLIDNELKSLKGKLLKAKTTPEAVDAIRESQQELKKIEKENMTLNELSQALQQNELTKDLGEAMSANNIEQTKQQLKQLNEVLKNMSQEELSQLGKELSEISEQLSDNNQAKQLLNQLGNAMANNSDLQEINQLMQQVSDTLEQQAQQNAELQKAINNLNNSLENSANSMQGKPQQSNQQQNNNQNQGSQQGQGTNQQGQNPAQNPNKQAQNTGQTDPQTNNSGQQGQCGTNPTQGENGNANQQQGQNGQSGKEQGSGHIPNENIYTELSNNNLSDVDLKGIQDENGEYSKSKETGNGPAGEIVPYGSVVEQYRTEALEGMNNAQLPQGMENIVKDYFTDLD